MKLAVLAFALAIPALAVAEVISKTVEWKVGGGTMKGYLVYDNSIKGKRPGVIVIHEWWGLTDYPKKRAEMLAKLGYVALAADMYGDGKTADNPADAQKFAGESMKDANLLKSKFLAAMDFLKQDEHTDPTRIAAIGYCYGGGVVLNMARAGVDLRGVVSFHGSLGAVIPAEKGKVKANILVCDGEADRNTSPEVIEGFRKEMENAGVNYRFISYPSAKHAFTNPDADERARKFNSDNIGYYKQADLASWNDMITFFDEFLNA